MKEAIADLGLRAGIAAFRLGRRVDAVSRMAPTLFKVAQLISPVQTTDVDVSSKFGIQMRLPAGYRDARSVRAGLFQKDETELFERLIARGNVIADLGAYVGYFSLLAAHLTGPSGRVYAFEPDAKAFSYLLTNITSNGFRNIEAVSKAATDGQSEMSLVRDSSGPESYLTTDQRNGAAFRVECITLDQYFAAAGWPSVDFIKMNIEGSEHSALRGLRELSRRNNQLKLVMEFNPIAMARAGVSREELTETLRDIGFRHAAIVERWAKPLTKGELLPNGPAVYNLLLTK